MRTDETVVRRLKDEVTRLKTENEYLIALGLQRDSVIESLDKKMDALVSKMHYYLSSLEAEKVSAEVDVFNINNTINYVKDALKDCLYARPSKLSLKELK